MPQMRSFRAVQGHLDGCKRRRFGVYAIENVRALRLRSARHGTLDCWVTTQPALPAEQVSVCRPVYPGVVTRYVGRKKIKPEP